MVSAEAELYCHVALTLTVPRQSHPHHFAPNMFLFSAHGGAERGYYIPLKGFLSPCSPPTILSLLPGLSILRPHGPRKSSRVQHY